MEAVSPYGLAAYQLQWHELMLEGINFLEEAVQVGSIAVRPGPALPLAAFDPASTESTFIGIRFVFWQQPSENEE